MFHGRYGLDKFSRTLLILAFGIGIINIFLPYYSPLRTVFSGLSTLIIIAAGLRMFSKNIPARQRELYQYLSFETKARSWWIRVKDFFRGNRSHVVDEVKDRRKYKYLRCPQCSQKLRVPKGKGRLRVTCTRCSCKFEAKS